MHSVICRGNEFLMQSYVHESYGVYYLHAMTSMFVFCVLHLFTLIFYQPAAVWRREFKRAGQRSTAQHTTAGGELDSKIDNNRYTQIDAKRICTVSL